MCSISLGAYFFLGLDYDLHLFPVVGVRDENFVSSAGLTVLDNVWILKIKSSYSWDVGFSYLEIALDVYISFGEGFCGIGDEYRYLYTLSASLWKDFDLWGVAVAPRLGVGISLPIGATSSTVPFPSAGVYLEKR